MPARIPNDPDEIEQVVRTRLRSLRNTLGLSLDELAARANLSPSTISRVETGKRTISLDVLLPLAGALQVPLDALLDVRRDDDVVIRPAPSTSGKRTTWMLNRPTGWRLPVRGLVPSAGAGFVVVLCGDMQRMPGLGRTPAFKNIDVDEQGRTVGLF